MSPAAWAATAAIVGPLLAFITYLVSRPQIIRSGQTEQMTATVTNALSTTEIMKGLLKPMEDEINDLRQDIAALRRHILLLEKLVLALGGELPPYPDLERVEE